MATDVPLTSVSASALVVDAVLLGGTAGNAGDDPVSKILPVGNVGGIRFSGTATLPRVMALVSSGEHTDWPDLLDTTRGEFVYYGDNRSPGKDLHATPRKGNLALRSIFDYAADNATRHLVPPILLFQGTGSARSYRFLGLAVPRPVSGRNDDALVAVWHSTGGLRYQNYRARFAVLDVAELSVEWLEGLRGNADPTINAPAEWLSWRNGGRLKALTAAPTRPFRTPAEQAPANKRDTALLAAIYEHFSERPTLFEQFAADIVEERLGAVVEIDMTRPTRDGGRDATGLFRVGVGKEAITIDFAMEAKCYAAGNSVGVRELSRLISRLRHRQFGVLVTTSHLAAQAYQELKEDRHPIVVISGREIAETVSSASWVAGVSVRDWLRGAYPVAPTRAPARSRSARLSTRY